MLKSLVSGPYALASREITGFMLHVCDFKGLCQAKHRNFDLKSPKTFWNGKKSKQFVPFTPLTSWKKKRQMQLRIQASVIITDAKVIIYWSIVSITEQFLNATAETQVVHTFIFTEKPLCFTLTVPPPKFLNGCRQTVKENLMLRWCCGGLDSLWYTNTV